MLALLFAEAQCRHVSPVWSIAFTSARLWSRVCQQRRVRVGAGEPTVCSRGAWQVRMCPPETAQCSAVQPNCRQGAATSTGLHFYGKALRVVPSLLNSRPHAYGGWPAQKHAF